MDRPRWHRRASCGALHGRARQRRFQTSDEVPEEGSSVLRIRVLRLRCWVRRGTEERDDRCGTCLSGLASCC